MPDVSDTKASVARRAPAVQLRGADRRLQPCGGMLRQAQIRVSR